MPGLLFRLLPAAGVVAGMGVATHSVVRYRLGIVAGYTVLAAALTWWQLRRAPASPVAPSAGAFAAALGLAAVLHVKVWAYSYDTLSQRAQIRWLFAIVSALVAALLVGAASKRSPRWAPDAALGVAVLGYVAAAVLLIRWDPAPRIDVWVSLQQAADAIPQGRNIYALNWHGSPGVQDAFTYLPLTALLLACLGGWALGVQRGNVALAVVCLALGLASKQHLVLLLPLLAVRPPLGLRPTAAAAVVAGAAVLPWFLASPADLWHDTVSLLIHFQPLVFADTLYIAAINDLRWTPPFWVTGALVLGTLALAVVMIRRRSPDLAGVLRWAALVLFVANLVNKQAFYNQYWLVAALVVVSLAVPAEAVPAEAVPATPEPATPARRPAGAEA